MNPWLIGELNPYGADPEMALYPLPEHASGGRLARILGLSRTQYLRAFERRNLCVGRWSIKTARHAASGLLGDAPPEVPIIMLGVKVAAAFGHNSAIAFDHVYSWGRHFYALPHPSGLNRLWNETDAVKRARALVLPLIEEKP